MGEKHKVDLATLEIERGKRGVKAKLYYEGGKFPEENLARPLRELRGKDDKDVLAQAKEWLAGRTVKKLLIACGVCKNGVELQQIAVTGKPYKWELYCGACGVTLYRGATKLAWPG